MKKRLLFSFILILVIILSTGLVYGAEYEDYPERSITMIVPFSPGGATDQIGRKLEKHMEDKLGVPIAVQNMPGGATAVGAQNVYDKPHDGYTILVEPTDIVSIAVMGQSELTWKDWDWLGVAAAVPGMFVVHPDSEIDNMKDVEKIIQEEKISCAVAASGCAWTRTMGLFAQHVDGIIPEMVPMGGGAEAATAMLKGDVDITACGVPEAIDLIEGGKLKPLAYMGNEDIKVNEDITIPAITNEYPDLSKYTPFGGWVGMCVPNGTPKPIVEKLQSAYNYAIQQEDFKNYLEDMNFIEVGLSGEEAAEYVETSTRVNAWILEDLGLTKYSPEKFNISRP